MVVALFLKDCLKADRREMTGMKEETHKDEEQQISVAATLYFILMPEGPVTDSTDYLFIWGSFAFF